MSERRRQIRVAPRGIVPHTGRIFLGAEAGSINCRIVDVSATGACLDIPTTLDFPPRFEFVYGNTRKYCNLVWRRKFRIGIRFEGTTQRTVIKGGLSRGIGSRWR